MQVMSRYVKYYNLKMIIISQTNLNIVKIKHLNTDTGDYS